MNKKYYITSAIPYVNANPHIGHAQEFIYSDVIRRYYQLLNKDVIYLSGADENALKIVQAAEDSGKSIQEFCDIHNQEFLDLAARLNVHLDIWQRATDKKRHFLASQKLWLLCQKNDDIYKKIYTGLYCVGCETFYASDELNDKGECFEHPGKKLDKVSEENYFFRLSRYQKFLEDLISSNKLEVIPNIRKNEVLAFVKRGLDDFSISRSRQRAKNWGVPVPEDQNQIMYVWFDALNIYQSGIGFGWDWKTYKKLWPQDVMVIGKGIIRFHAVYWPAILKSAGLELPKVLFVHGYLTVNGQKMSKTLGNVVDPVKIVEKYSTDSLRYYLLREIPSYADGDFSERRFKELYNADLANGLGNLVARLAKLAQGKSYQPKIASYQQLTNQYSYFKKALDEFRFNDALAFVWEKVAATNKRIDEKKPWDLDGEKLNKVLWPLIGQILEISTLLQPFLPETSKKILT
ncbi:methionine--tRNA ligase, partial [Candidatus Gottesmanbacteria bacterium]|nr:methionine--tRNA ligase [Candidatus Gottesmanbacteria bacterium]